MTAPLPEEAVTAAYAEFRKLYPQRTAGWGDLAEWERDRWRRIIGAAAAVIAAGALEPVYRWLADDLMFPFDMHTDDKPAWLDVERLAAVWDARDGEQPGTYLDAIYDETGWPRP